MSSLLVCFFSIRSPPGLLPVLGPLERYMTPTLDSALLCSSKAGADLGRASDGLRSFRHFYLFIQLSVFFICISGFGLLDQRPSTI